MFRLLFTAGSFAAAAGGATVSLDGELVATATIDASLQVTRQPAAELVAVAVVDGAATVTRQPAGELVAVAVIDGAIASTRNLAGELVAVAIIDGSITTGEVLLSGELVALAVIDGTPQVQRNPAGELVALAVVDGGLTITRQPAAELAALATIDGQLVNTRNAAGELAALAIIDGDLTVTAQTTSVFLDEIAAWLIAGNVASSSGSGVGWYLTRGSMPDSTGLPHRMVAILETGGFAQLPNVTIDQPTFQVLVRGAPIIQTSTAYQEAKAKAIEARERLHFIVGQTILDADYAGIVATEEPGFVGEDDRQRPVFSCAFRAWREVP